MNGLGVSGWRVDRIRSRTLNISHPWIAQAPGCPNGPHPTRDCGCRVFRTKEQAEGYVAERKATP